MHTWSSSDKCHRLTFVSNGSFCMVLWNNRGHHAWMTSSNGLSNSWQVDVFSDSDNWGHISTRNVKPPVRILSVFLSGIPSVYVTGGYTELRCHHGSRWYPPVNRKSILNGLRCDSYLYYQYGLGALVYIIALHKLEL